MIKEKTGENLNSSNWAAVLISLLAICLSSVYK